MKKLVVILFVLGFSLWVNGQNEFKGGIMAGPVVTQISGDGLGGWDKLGFAAGAWVSMPLSEALRFNIQMKYTTKGSRTKRDTLNNNSFAYHLNYIDVPLLLSYRLPFKRSQLSLNVGPYAGVLVKQKIVSNGYDYAVNPPFEQYDIGASIGLTWWLGERFFMDISTSSSVLPTRPAPLVVNKGSYYEQGNTNQMIQFILGLQVGGRKD